MYNLESICTTWYNSLHHDAAKLQLPPPSCPYLVQKNFSPPRILLVLQPEGRHTKAELIITTMVSADALNI